MRAPLVVRRRFSERTENFLDDYHVRLNHPPLVQWEQLKYQRNRLVCVLNFLLSWGLRDGRLVCVETSDFAGWTVLVDAWLERRSGEAVPM